MNESQVKKKKNIAEEVAVNVARQWYCYWCGVLLIYCTLFWIFSTASSWIYFCSWKQHQMQIVVMFITAAQFFSYTCCIQ